jgi:hypothetical protein
MQKSRLKVVLAVLGLAGSPAWAGGFLTNDLPPAGAIPGTFPFTGNETIPLDTNLPMGQVPQSESASLTQLAQFFGGGGGAGSTFGQAFPTTGGAIGAYNSGNMVYVGADGSHNLLVNCAAGCVAGTGTFNNNSDAVATSSTNGQAASWLYGFNGATWDRLRVDGSKNLFVDLATALPAGGNVIGAVTQSGTWNLGSITGSISLPSGAATSALQTNVRQTVAAGTVASNSVLIGGIYNSSPITMTNGQGAAVQLDANGYLEVNIKSGGGSGGTSSTFTSAFPSTGTAIGASNGGNMVYLAADGSHNLQVNCTVGCSSSGGSSLADTGTYTLGTTSFTVTGGTFNSSPGTLSSGQAGAVQITSDRMMFTNLGKVNAVAVLTGAGATGTGAQRVAVAQDTTTLAGSAPGTAGSPSANVVSVQGVGSGTALPVSQSGTWNLTNITGSVVLPTGAATATNQTNVQGPVGAGTAASNSLLVGGIYNASPPSLGTGQQAGLQVDSSGNIKISCQAGCTGTGGTSSADSATYTQGTTSFTPIGGLYTTSVTNLTSGQAGAAQLTTDRMLYVNVGKIGGTGVAVGAGAAGGGVQRVTVAQDSTTIAGSASLPAGSNTIGSVALSNILTNPTSTLTMTAATTAYTAGWLIANNATAGSVTVPSFAIATSGGGAVIPRLRLRNNDTTSTSWGGQTIQVDLWTAAPTFTNGDRGVWLTATGSAGHVGSYLCGMSAVQGDGIFAECSPSVGSYSTVKLASGTSVYWTLQATTGSGVTGASKVWTLTAELLN